MYQHIREMLGDMEMMRKSCIKLAGNRPMAEAEVGYPYFRTTLVADDSPRAVACSGRSCIPTSTWPTTTDSPLPHPWD